MHKRKKGKIGAFLREKEKGSLKFDLKEPGE